MKLHLIAIALIASIGLFACFESSWLEAEWFSWKGKPRTVIKSQVPAPDVRSVQVVSFSREPTAGGSRNNHIGVFDSWRFWCFVFVAINAAIGAYAKKTIDSICDQSKLSSSEKLTDIENQDILFDLPLYMGLLGTVFGFILISHGYSSSRDAAYISTVVGIIASADMRLLVLRPTKARILGRERDEAELKQIAVP